MGISKTGFMRGMQCRKMLWLDNHKPEERKIPKEIQEKLDKGNAFGDKAMGMFGDYVEVTSIKPNGLLDYEEMKRITTECINNRVNVICEASFSYFYNFCSVDILRRVNGGYEIYEVKDCETVETQFIKDVGFQKWILEKCKVNVVACYVVYHGADENNPFLIKDVTAEAKSYSYEVDDNIWVLGRIKKQEEEPCVKMGEQCHCPYDCWYLDYCKKLQDKI